VTTTLTQARLNSLIPETFLRSVIFFDEIDSTNSRALDLLSRNDVESLPLLIAANVQHAGRGRGSNEWWSSEGSLTFTLVLDTTALGLATEDQPRVSLVAGLSLVETGHALLPRANFAVKWPNDVYLEARKLAGILDEVSPRRPECLAIGIGININNSFEAAPQELQQTGISLRDIAGQPFDRVTLLGDWLRAFEKNLAEVARGEFDLQGRWEAACLLTGKTVRIQTAAGTPPTAGRCVGISSEGALVVQTATGRERLFGGIVQSWE
jgi:BirA family biotin operon repressor/biotin-[acetyl-CoA-carboxylase] ligase